MRRLHLNLFVRPAGHHEAAWRHPRGHRVVAGTLRDHYGLPRPPSRYGLTRRTS